MHQQVRGFTPVHCPFIGSTVYPLGFAPLVVCARKGWVKTHSFPVRPWSGQLSDCCSPTLLTRQYVGIILNHLFKRVPAGVARKIKHSIHLVQSPV